MLTSATGIVRTLIDLKILLDHDGEKLRAVSFQPGALTPEIEETLMTHKAELLEFLAWQDAADELLLGTTRSIGMDYPSGCPLDTQEWARLDDDLRDAFWSGDLNLLRSALAERERLARAMFAEYRQRQETSP